MLAHTFSQTQNRIERQWHLVLRKKKDMYRIDMQKTFIDQFDLCSFSHISVVAA